MIRLFFIALSFFTRIPIKIRGEVSEKDFFSSMLLMPFVGLVIGLLLYGFAWLIKFISYIPGQALMTMVFFILLTGGLHLDGVADTGDAIFSARDREQMMRIMKDSRLGSFGAVSLILLILSLFIGFSYIYETGEILLFILVPIVGRFSAIELAAFSKPAEGGGGLGKGFCEVDKPWIAIVYFIIILVALIFFFPTKIILAFVLTCFFVLLEVFYFKKKLGGITGDQNGLTIELGQVIFIYAVMICSSMLR